MLDWLGNIQRLGWWIVAASILGFVGSLIVVPVLVVRMPADYFADRARPPESWRGRHPAIRMTVLGIKNLSGFILVTAGLVMLFTPGQGMLAILIGLSLLDMPGKRALERRIIGNPTVLGGVNALRARAGRPPLKLS